MIIQCDISIDINAYMTDKQKKQKIVISLDLCHKLAFYDIHTGTVLPAKLSINNITVT